jgi:hypothetical protein
MKGHIRERSPGRWAIVIDVRDPQTGKRKRRWRSFKGTKREAQTRCAQLIAELESGTNIDPARISVAAISINGWPICGLKFPPVATNYMVKASQTSCRISATSFSASCGRMRSQ